MSEISVACFLCAAGKVYWDRGPALPETFTLKIVFGSLDDKTCIFDPGECGLGLVSDDALYSNWTRVINPNNKT